jgi:hypothetical protein
MERRTDGHIAVGFECESTVYGGGKYYILFGSLVGLVDEDFAI